MEVDAQKVWGNMLKMEEICLELKESCCDHIRLDSFELVLKRIGFSQSYLEKKFYTRPYEMMVGNGEVLGRLAVTCCVREKMERFAECFKLLNQIVQSLRKLEYEEWRKIQQTQTSKEFEKSMNCMLEEE